MPSQRDNLPSWLASSEDYRPGSDRDGFLSRNLLHVSDLLTRMRLPAEGENRLSPSAPIKLLIAFVCVLLVSLARNYLFVLVMLALVLLRACLLPSRTLARVAAGAGAAAVLTALVMLPAMLLGQTSAPLWLATKALVSTGIVLTVALTTPVAQLTGALRAAHVPAIVILTLDLTLRSIVSLAQTAHEVLCALALRSVGRNTHKQTSMGGVGGVVLVKAARAAQDTHDAMCCRGFDGSYDIGRPKPRAIDALWIVGLGLCIALFAYLQGALP